MESAVLELRISMPTAPVLFQKMRPKMWLRNEECSPGTVNIHPNCSSFIPQNVAEKYRVQPWNCWYPSQLLQFYSEKCGPKCGGKMRNAVLELQISTPTAPVLFRKMRPKMRPKNVECSPGTADIHANCSGFIPKNAAQNVAEK